MSAKAAAAARPVLKGRGLIAFAGVFVGVSILLGLGVWQVERLQWKTRLLQRIEALKTAPPEPLGVVLNRIEDHVDVDYTHVTFACPDVERRPFTRIYAVGADGPGDRIVAACPLPPGGPYRTVLVDRGFLADETPAGAGRPAVGPLTGVLRAFPAAPPRPKSASGRYFQRNLGQIAAALGADRPAPVWFMLESPRPAAGPVPEPVPTDIPNNHLGYAVTWFGLAIALLGVYAASLRRRPGTRP